MAKKQLTLDYWLSPTKILMFSEQYSDFYKNFFLGKEIPQNVYMKYGSLFHQLLEDYFKNGPESNETVREYTNRIIKQKWLEYVATDEDFKELSTNDRNIKTLKEDIQFYINRFLKEIEPLEQKYGSKSAFKILKPHVVEMKIEDEELKLKGILDTVFLTSDRFNPNSNTLISIIGDYKTSNTNSSSIFTKYFFQLLVYAYLMKRKTGKQIDYVMLDFVRTGEKHFLMFDKFVFFDLSDYLVSVRMEIDDLIRKYKKGIDISDYKPKNTLEKFYKRLYDETYLE